MPRIRLSTTVDEQKLAAARALGLGSDASTMDAALNALLSEHRAAEIDAAYEAYARHPLSEPDEWGDLDAFHNALHRAKQPRRRAS